MPKVTAAVPLTIVATTAGVGTGGIGHELYAQAKDIASGKISNPSWLPIIYEAEPGDDWRDEHLWHRCNFALGTFKSLRGLRNEAIDAATSLTRRREFERYHLNIWHEGTGDPWIDLATYDQAGTPFDLDDVAHLPCFVGVDAGQTSDLTAVVALFCDFAARLFYVVPFLWVPAASIVKRSEEDSVPYGSSAERRSHAFNAANCSGRRGRIRRCAARSASRITAKTASASVHVVCAQRCSVRKAKGRSESTARRSAIRALVT